MGLLARRIDASERSENVVTLGSGEVTGFLQFRLRSEDGLRVGDSLLLLSR